MIRTQLLVFGVNLLKVDNFNLHLSWSGSEILGYLALRWHEVEFTHSLDLRDGQMLSLEASLA